MTSSLLRPSEQDALDAWRRLVEADAEQVTRLREETPDADHYQRTAPRFRPGRLTSEELPVIEALVEPGDAVLDIGAGGGRFAVPLAQRVARVIALEPSDAMRTTLGEAAAAAALTNLEVHDRRWPDPAWDQPVDVSLAAHVLYDQADIGGFLDAMERWTRRTCIAVLAEEGRGAQLADLWLEVHGEPLAALPALPEFVALLAARRRRFEVRLARRGTGEPTTLDEAIETARRLLWLAPDSEKDRAMAASIPERYGTEDGRVRLPSWQQVIGVVSWEPPAGAG